MNNTCPQTKMKDESIGKYLDGENFFLPLKIYKDIKKFLGKRYYKIQLWLQKPILAIQFTKIASLKSSKNNNIILDEIQELLRNSKEEFNTRIERDKERVRFSFSLDEAVYIVRISAEIIEQNYEAKKLVIETENFINIPYRNRDKVDLMVTSFHKVCDLVENINAVMLRKNTTINVKVGIRDPSCKNKQLNFEIDACNVITNNNQLMICFQSFADIKKTIYESILEWYVRTKQDYNY